MSRKKRVDMINNDSLNIILQIFDAIKDMILGMFGGIVNYLFVYTKAKKSENPLLFSTAELIINAIIGGFMGYTISQFLDPTMKGYTGLVAMSGAISYKLLEIVEEASIKIISNKLGIELDDKKQNNKKDNK